MTKVRTKMVIAVLLTPVLIAVVLSIVFGISQFLSYFQQGADPASIFLGHELIIPEENQAVWLSTAPLDGVSPSRAQQEELISAYWLGWVSLSRAYKTGHTDNLSTYWAAPILDTLTDSIVAGIDYQTSEHQLSLLFFSDDRSVAQIQDQFSLIVNGIDSLASATATLTLDTGRWRVRMMTIDYKTNN